MLAADVLINLSQPPVAAGLTIEQRLAYMDEAEALVTESDPQGRQPLIEKLKAELFGGNEIPE